MLQLFNMLSTLLSKNQTKPKNSPEPSNSDTFKRIFQASILLLGVFASFFFVLSISSIHSGYGPGDMLLTSMVLTVTEILISLFLFWLLKIQSVQEQTSKHTKKPVPSKLPFSLPAAVFWSAAISALILVTYAFSAFTIAFFLPAYTSRRIFMTAFLTTLLMILFSGLMLSLQMNEGSTVPEDWEKDHALPLRTVVRWGVFILGAFLGMYALFVHSILPLSPFYASNGVFKLALVVTLIVIPFQVIAYVIIFQHNKTPMKKFYIFPQVRLGIRFLGIQFLLSLTLMVFSAKIPFEVALTLEGIAIGLAVVLFNLNDITRIVIEQQESNLKKDANFMRIIRQSTAALPRLTDDPQIKARLEQLWDLIQYSDPVGTKESADIEKELCEDINRLTKELEKKSGSPEAILSACDKIQYKLEQRNSICLNI